VLFGWALYMCVGVRAIFLVLFLIASTGFYISLPIAVYTVYRVWTSVSSVGRVDKNAKAAMGMRLRVPAPPRMPSTDNLKDHPVRSELVAGVAVTAPAPAARTAC
jgi:hypothetical protein